MENKSLLLIVNEAVSLENMLIESGGEITPEIEKALLVSASELSNKVDGYHHIIERFGSLEEHYKNRADFFASISKQCANAVKRLQENIKYAMLEMGISEIEGQDMRFKLSKTSGSLEITNEDMIPLDFKSEVITTSIDKKALKDALAKGAEITGAKLNEGYSVRAYANKPSAKTKAVK